MKSKHLILIVVIVVIVAGLWFWKGLPDPYHEEEGVNVFTWVQREIDELIHGEREEKKEEESCD